MYFFQFVRACVSRSEREIRVTNSILFLYLFGGRVSTFDQACRAFTWFSIRNLLCILRGGFLDVIYAYARLKVLAGAQANLIFMYRSRILLFR